MVMQKNGLKSLKRTMTKCFETNTDEHLGLVQIRSTSKGLGLPSPCNITLHQADMRNITNVNGSLLCVKFEMNKTSQEQWYCHRACIYTHSVYSTCASRRWWALDTWYNNRTWWWWAQWLILQYKYNKDRQSSNKVCKTLKANTNITRAGLQRLGFKVQCPLSIQR